MDVAGDNQLEVEHEMIKQRLTKHGLPIGAAGIEIIGEVSTGFSSLIFTTSFAFLSLLSFNIHVSLLLLLQGPLTVEDHPANYCGDCYGADTETLRCCNTCNELIQAYQQKQWSINEILRNSTQCIHDRAKHFSNLNPDEGCTVSGRMLVNKVAGNFHIAQGESIVRDGRHIHQFNPTLAPKFNVSHTIHSLSFGDPYPSMPGNPLDKGKNSMYVLF